MHVQVDYTRGNVAGLPGRRKRGGAISGVSSLIRGLCRWVTLQENFSPAVSTALSGVVGSVINNLPDGFFPLWPEICLSNPQRSNWEAVRFFFKRSFGTSVQMWCRIRTSCIDRFTVVLNGSQLFFLLQCMSIKSSFLAEPQNIKYEHHIFPLTDFTFYFGALTKRSVNQMVLCVQWSSLPVSFAVRSLQKGHNIRLLLQGVVRSENSDLAALHVHLLYTSGKRKHTFKPQLLCLYANNNQTHKDFTRWIVTHYPFIILLKYKAFGHLVWNNSHRNVSENIYCHRRDSL